MLTSLRGLWANPVRGISYKDFVTYVGADPMGYSPARAACARLLGTYPRLLLLRGIPYTSHDTRNTSLVVYMGDSTRSTRSSLENELGLRVNIISAFA